MNRQQRRQNRRAQAEKKASQRNWYWWIGGGTLGVVVIVLLVLTAAGVFGDGSGGDLSSGEIDRLTSEGHLIGDASAPVTVIEFADFQCPFCQDFWSTTYQYLKTEFIESGQVALYFHHMAFIGDESVLAASASECAADQGQFDAYMDVLYEQQGPENRGYITQDRLEGFAQEVGLDLVAFSNCVRNGTHEAEVRSDTDSAGRAGINSTPTLIVNGKIVDNALNLAEVRQAVLDALAAS